MAEEEKPIRVVDRRMFTSDGQLRPDFEAEEKPEPPQAPEAPSRPPAGMEGSAPAPDPGTDRVASQAFIGLVSFLASNVYAALGIDPKTEIGRAHV